MTIFTRRGDEGLTDLWGGIRVRKDDPIIEMLGTLDEVSAFVGLARSAVVNDEVKAPLLKIQDDLYRIMVEIASKKKKTTGIKHIDSDDVVWLEKQIEKYEHEISLPNSFIPAGDTYKGALLDVCRTVVRRAERFAVSLLKSEREVNKDICVYLNRLSSLLYILRVFMDAK